MAHRVAKDLFATMKVDALQSRATCTQCPKVPRRWTVPANPKVKCVENLDSPRQSSSAKASKSLVADLLETPMV